MSHERPSRRRFLALSASAAVVGGLTGCGSEGGATSDGPGTDTTDTDETTRRLPEDAAYGTPYREWTPANRATDGEEYRPEVWYWSYDSMRRYRTDIGAQMAALQPRYDFFDSREGVEPSDVRAALTIDDTGVFLGSFDADALATSLRSLGSMSDGEDYGDYRGVDARSFWLVGPDAIVVAASRADAVALAETNAGERPRAFEGSGGLDPTATAAGPGTVFYAAETAGRSDPVRERPANVRTVAHTLTLGSEETAFDFVFDHDDGAPDGFAADAEADIRERYPVQTVAATQTDSRVTYRGTIETNIFEEALGVFQGTRWGSLPLPGADGRGRR